MTVKPAPEAVIWQDVECGAFAADLPLWEELARGADPILDLGCGSGRVALHLARRGHRVWGLDSDPALVDELRTRAGADDLRLTAIEADAAGFALDRRFGLILAPMQLIQLLPDSGARSRCLEAIATHLAPQGLAALAIVDPETIVEEMASGVPPSALLPDVRERDGWVYSSLPMVAILQDDALLVERLRQTVDPKGHMQQSRGETRLCLLTPEQLEQEARRAGLNAAGRRRIDPTDTHVGSIVVLLEA
jgi:SAM-dependent methyltransferase